MSSILFLSFSIINFLCLLTDQDNGHEAIQQGPDFHCWYLFTGLISDHLSYIYIRLLNHKCHTAHVRIKVQVIQNMAHRTSMQASYMIGLGMTMQENQLAAQIAARHNIFPQMALYMIYVMNLFGAGGNRSRVSHLGGEIVSHNTTEARQDLFMSDHIYPR